MTSRRELLRRTKVTGTPEVRGGSTRLHIAVLAVGSRRVRASDISDRTQVRHAWRLVVSLLVQRSILVGSVRAEKHYSKFTLNAR